MKEKYLESVNMIERLHRLSLDMIQVELERMGINDINSTRCLIIYNIGKEHLAICDLIYRGYYLGTNSSYNTKLLVKNGYLIHEPSTNDHRSRLVRLSEKGLELYEKLDKFFTSQSMELEKVFKGNATETLYKLHDFWGNDWTYNTV